MIPASSPDELEHLKGTFLASLNHEIRTPLAGIMGMADLLLETELTEEQREYVQTARLCAENLFEILNETLEYSALQAGQFTLDESEFSLREMLEAALAQHRARAAAKNLALPATVDPALPETLIGDALRLRELLGHLIANAIKFTQAGSVEVRIACGVPPEGSAHKDWLSMQVSDTGIGIAPDALGEIFESFPRSEREFSREHPGLGLGLALARKLASAMGGEIGVQSTLGSGSTFRVRVPFRRAPGDRPEKLAAGETRPGPAILAVDDNLVGLTVLRHALQKHRLEPDCVGSGREALAAAAHRRYDLVLMDLQMPEMDGLAAAAELRKIPGYEAIPIIALTANTGDEIRELCRAHGMQAYLSKPVEAGELWAAVERHLA